MPHEVLPLVSIGEWGAAAEPGGWLQEGLAEWDAGTRCGEVPLGQLDRYLHRRGDGLSLATLTEEFWEHSDVITMPQATTLVGYLMDAHGLEAVRGRWDRGIEEAEAEAPQREVIRKDLLRSAPRGPLRVMARYEYRCGAEAR